MYSELYHCCTVVTLQQNSGKLWDAEVESSHLWGHSLKKEIPQNTLQGTVLQNKLEWLKFVLVTLLFLTHVFCAITGYDPQTNTSSSVADWPRSTSSSQ